MKVDNQKNTYRIWIRRLTMTIVFTLAIIILIFIPWFDTPDLPVNEFHVMILVAAIYIAISILNTMKIPYFVSYDDHGEMIVMRYYPLSLFNSKKHSRPGNESLIVMAACCVKEVNYVKKNDQSNDRR